MAEKILLATDIGATKTVLAYYSSAGSPNEPLDQVTLQNREFNSFDDLLGNYFDQHSRKFDGICMGIAGPVIGNTVHITNLGWDISGAELKSKHKVEGVWLLNDLKALSYSVPSLGDSEFEVIRVGEPVEGAPLAVIAPGTGLGEGFLIWDGEGYLAVSTEGGHTDFGPVNELQRGLLSFLHKNDIRVSYERVCSGIGVPNLYAYLRDEKVAEEPEWLREKLSQADDITPVIFDTSLDESIECEICDLTIQLFVEILGAEAGNLALKTLAQGGIFVGGGIPPRILPWLKKDLFLNAIDQKDPHNEMMSQIPVKVILNKDANLIGAATFGLKQLSRS
jgi:glucokinase